MANILDNVLLDLKREREKEREKEKICVNLNTVDSINKNVLLMQNITDYFVIFIS